MNNSRNDCRCTETPYSVRCDAKKCIHHDTDGTCRADSIRVANESALTKSETFCATYEMK